MRNYYLSSSFLSRPLFLLLLFKDKRELLLFTILMMATAEEEIRRRLLDVAPEPNESLPFHGRVRLARRKKPDRWYIIAGEVG